MYYRGEGHCKSKIIIVLEKDNKIIKADIFEDIRFLCARIYMKSTR